MPKSARYYSPEMVRFISEDPIGLAGGDVNYFAYVKNQPCNASDPMGLKPGDPFDTEEQAVVDAIDFIIPQSEKENREYDGFVFYNKEVNKYFCTTPVPGTETEIDVTTFEEPPEGTTSVGIYHTHHGTGYNVPYFSIRDQLLASFHNTNIYLGTSTGLVKKYNPWIGEMIIRRSLKK